MILPTFSTDGKKNKKIKIKIPFHIIEGFAFWLSYKSSHRKEAMTATENESKRRKKTHSKFESQCCCLM